MQDPGHVIPPLIARSNPNIAHPAPQVISKSASVVTRSSALGSHSPFAPLQSAPSEQPVQHDNARPRLHRRRNTLPSLILSDQEARTLAKTLRQIDALHHSEVDPETQVAAQVTAKRWKRRSRSADALTDAADSYQSPIRELRRRSGEIAYWRNSVMNGLPAQPAKSTQDPDTWDVGQVTAEQQQQQEEEEEEIEESIPIAAQSEYRTPDPDQFEPVDTADDQVTLEQRVNTLEIKMIDFEYAIAKLQGHDISDDLTSRSQAPKNPSVHELFRQEPAPPTIVAAGPPRMTFLESPVDSPIEPSNDITPTRTDHSSKVAMIRPLPAVGKSAPRRPMPPSPTTPRLVASDVEAIMALIREEQFARKQLETQVVQLQREVAELRAPIYATIRPVGYPTPSPDTPHESPAPPRAKTLHRTTPFVRSNFVAVPETSRFSTTDPGDESDTEEGFQDVYETPQDKKFEFDLVRSSPRVAII